MNIFSCLRKKEKISGEKKIKLKYISPKEIPPIKRSRKPKPFYHKFHDKIKKLLEDAGFKIERSNYYKKGADIVAVAENHRIIVQCKCAKEKNKAYAGIDRGIDEYSTKVKKENAQVAILALGKYRISKEYQKLEKKEMLLKKQKVVIWDDKEIDYYSTLVGALKKCSKYPILGDLNCKEEFASPISLPAIKIKQKGIEFCVFSISPEILLKIADVFRRIRDRQAYQRMVNKKRLEKEIKEFLEGRTANKPIFPTNLVCVFKKDGARFDNEAKKLVIPMKYSNVWIVDGQHRLYGFCQLGDLAKNGKFELICVGFNIAGIDNSFLDISDQAGVFVTINEKAKRVSKELLIDIALRTGTANRRMKVVDKLKKTKIFTNKIKTIDTSGKIHIATFVDTAPMKKLIGDSGIVATLSKWYDKPIGKEKEIPSDKEESFIEFCSQIFEDYFSIIGGIFKKEWGKPKEYILATDRGIRGMLRILEDVLDYSNGLKDQEKAKKCLKVLKGFDFRSSKLKRMYLGEAGADNLAARLIGKIKIKYTDFGPQPTVREEQIEPGQKDHAGEIIKSVLSKFDGDVIGELPHIDHTTFKYLDFIPSSCPIKLFIDGAEDREKCIDAVKKLMKRRARIEIKEVRRLDGGAFIHDRWLSEDNVMIDFGQDLKDRSLGKNRHKIKISDKAHFAPSYLTFNEYWRTPNEEFRLKGGKWEWFFKPKRY